MLKIVFSVIGLLISTWLIYRLIYLRRVKRQYHHAFLESFTDREFVLPKLKTGYSYGYPTFQLVFSSKDQLILAEKNGLTKIFESKIQKIHEDIDDFDAEKAIDFTWEGRTYKVLRF